jgi:carboxyl-terminal processing protease
MEIVWSRVKERHFDPGLNGVDWEAVRLRYVPRVLAAGSDAEYYRVLNEMLGELRQSHFTVFPPWVYTGEENGREGRAEAGFDVRLVEGRATIARVEKASPAAEAGLRPGFVVTHVGDESLDALLERIRASKHGHSSEGALMRAVRTRLRGEPGSTVEVRYLDARGRPRTVALARRFAEGELVSLGELPSYRVVFEGRRLPGNVGYLRFNLFMLPVLPRVRAAMSELRDARGIVLDLRGNAGGEPAVATAIAGLFHTSRCSLGTTRFREGELHRIVHPSAEPFTGPLVILTDEGTASAAETFAAALQESGRATVAGARSAGGALPSVFEKLPTGARLQYAIGEYRTPKGVVLEGRGVIPDARVALTRRDLLRGRDAALDAAVAVIR